MPCPTGVLTGPKMGIRHPRSDSTEVPATYSHEPGLGQVPTEDGLDGNDGLLLGWVVFSRGDGAWDTGCRRALQSMTRGDRPVWGHPVSDSKCSTQRSPRRGASQLTPHCSFSPSPTTEFTLRCAGSNLNAKLARDVLSQHGMGGAPGTSARPGRPAGLRGLRFLSRRH